MPKPINHLSEALEHLERRCGNCDLWRLRDVIDGVWDWACPQSPDKDQNEQACNRWQPTYEVVEDAPTASSDLLGVNWGRQFHEHPTAP